MSSPRVPGSVACAAAFLDAITRHAGTWGQGNDHPRRVVRMLRAVRRFDRRWGTWFDMASSRAAGSGTTTTEQRPTEAGLSRVPVRARDDGAAVPGSGGDEQDLRPVQPGSPGLPPR